jgi:hypothetical protein
MCNGIDELAGAVGNALKVAPDLYDDALKSSAQETGKVLNRIPRLINAVLAPIDIWILNKEYNVEETKKLLAKKLENIDPEKIVSPESYVAVPAIQAISYSMNSEELRNMYANLLANSMNSDTKDSVHPAFVEIIKQLSPFEAKLLKSFSIEKKFPIIMVRASVDDMNSEGTDFHKHIIEPEFGITSDNLNAFAIAIDNLIRLNLISVNYEKNFVNEDIYNSILNSDLFLYIKNKVSETPKFNHCVSINGILEISDLGESFIKICII